MIIDFKAKIETLGKFILKTISTYSNRNSMPEKKFLREMNPFTKINHGKLFKEIVSYNFSDDFSLNLLKI